MGKITRINGIDDVVLGIGIFGLSSLVLGTAMIYGSVSGFSFFAAQKISAAPMVLNTLFNGISFIICSILFFLVSLLVLFPVRNIILLKAMEFFSLSGALFIGLSFLREVIVADNGYEILVTLSAVLISGFLFYIIRSIVKMTVSRIGKSRRSSENKGMLKNAG